MLDRDREVASLQAALEGLDRWEARTVLIEGTYRKLGIRVPARAGLGARARGLMRRLAVLAALGLVLATGASGCGSGDDGERPRDAGRSRWRWTSSPTPCTPGCSPPWPGSWTAATGSPCACARPRPRPTR